MDITPFIDNDVQKFLQSKAGDVINRGGADGQVFSIANEPDKVLKLSVIFSDKQDVIYNELSRVLQCQSVNNYGCFVSIHDFGMLDGRSGSQVSPLLHYYTMDKLYPISEDESRVFHSILSHEDANISKAFTIAHIQNMLSGMQIGLDFDANAVKLFVEELRLCPIVQPDMHARNIMKNSTGQFKIIDLDRCFLKPFNGD